MAHTSLAALTTLGVGGAVADYVEAGSEAELIDAIRRADEAQAPLLVLGGGSNVLAADAGFDGVVVRDVRAQIDVSTDPACAGAGFTATAGMSWDAVVERAVGEGWIGVECLSGIPGSTGATPVQNVGAYGQEVAGVIASVRTWDRAESRVRTLAHIDCRFGYRTSLLKQSLRADDAGRAWGPSPRYIVLDVMFQLRLGDLAAPIAYPQLAAALGVEVGERAPMADVRRAVLALRASKGMVLDAADPDTRSAGSFFTNPILTAEQAAALPADAPRYPVEGGDAGAVKTSAAWLIERAGLSKGFALDGSAASLSTKHTLALTNRGGATAAQLVDLARHVRATVREAFGVTLEPEPVLVGLEL